MKKNLISILQGTIGSVALAYLSYSLLTKPQTEENANSVLENNANIVGTNSNNYEINIHKNMLFDYFDKHKNTIPKLVTKSNGSIWSQEGDSLVKDMSEFRNLLKQYVSSVNYKGSGRQLYAVPSIMKPLTNHQKKVFDYLNKLEEEMPRFETRANGSVWSIRGDSLFSSVSELRSFFDEYDRNLKK